MMASTPVPPTARDPRPDDTAAAPVAPCALATALAALEDTGRGIWALLGTALALGLFRHGRGDTLVLLAIGSLFVLSGLAAAVLRRRDDMAWHGWRPGRAAFPTRAALLALAGFLPVLVVAGLSRGDNAFWATRMAGAVLMMCSLAGLLEGGSQGARALGLPPSRQAMLPTGRVMAALYGGGLWLWVSAAARPGLAVAPVTSSEQPWLLLLLIMALLLGLIEGMRWHALPGHGDGELPRAEPVRIAPGRLVAAILGYAVPCIALLIADRWQANGLLALLAAASALAGRILEQRLFAESTAAARSSR